MSKPSERSVGKDVGVDAGDQDLHFFKLMFGDFRERITIPDAFVKHFRGELARTITLESSSGLTFDVEITGNSEKLVLHSGWNAFASAHDLKMGNFLLFKYNGISQLKVLIFDPTGCEKALPCLLMNSPQSESSNQGNENVNISSPSRSSEDDQQAHPARRLILVRGTCPTGSQKKKLKVKIRDIYSEIPIFGCTIRMSNIHGKPCTLQICREYAEVYLPFEDETIVLRRHGKIWKVRCCISQYGSKRLLKGWMQFARGNNLRLGDICLLRLLKNKKKYTMDVHIIRKA